MSNQQLFWLETIKADRIDRLRQTITLPVGTFNCGSVNKSIRFQSDTGDIVQSPVAFADATTGFTIEVWVRPSMYSSETKYPIIFKTLNSGAAQQFELSLVGGNPKFYYTKGAVSAAVKSTLIVNSDQWNYIVVTWDGTTIRFYVNGVLDSTSFALASPIDSYIGGQVWFGYANGNAIGAGENPSQFRGNIDEFRFWNVALSTNDIIVRMFSPTLTVAQYSNLKSYVRFDNGSGLLVTDFVTGIDWTIEDPINVFWSIDHAPLKFGASFICAKDTITLDNKSSIKFPVVPSFTPDHALCVSWIDDSGVFQRRKLYDAAGVDIAPNPVMYQGEKLAATFDLEVWNVDGASTANITADLVLEISLTTLPTTSTDITETAAIASPTHDTTLAENFPLVFPLTFNIQQTY